MKKTQLFVSGIPGCGKSTFGRWLEAEKNFAYVDMEHDGLKTHGFRQSWDRFYDGTDTKTFIQALQTHPSSIVLDWGFPPSCVPIVQRIKDAGLAMIWLDGDRLSTRHYFAQRGTVPVSEFDTQFANICKHWSAIEPLFGSNIIKVVHADGTRLSLDIIFTRIFRPVT